MPTAGSANGVRSFSTKSGAQTASLLTRTITSGFGAAAAPRFTARPKPRFSSLWTTVTRGKRVASSSAVPSLDALSTTTISTGTVWSSMLASASASRSRAFSVGMTTTARTRQGTIRECSASSCGPPIPSESAWPARESGTTGSRPSSPSASRDAGGAGRGGRGTLAYAFRAAGIRRLAPRDLEADVVVAQSLPLGLARASGGAGCDSSTTSTPRRSSRLRRISRASRPGGQRGIRYEEVVATTAGRAPSSGTRSSVRANGSAIIGWARSRRCGRLTPADVRR